MANTINLNWVPTGDYNSASVSVPLSTFHVKRGTPVGWPWAQNVSTSRPTTGQIWPRGSSLEEILTQLSDLTDVNLSTLADGDKLFWDSASQTWKTHKGSIATYNTNQTFSAPGANVDITIAAVDTTRAFVVLNSETNTNSSVGLVGFQNSTTVRFTLNSGSSPTNCIVNFTVVELP